MRCETPRGLVLAGAVECLDPAQLLSVVLEEGGMPDAGPAGRRLLERFGDLRGLASAEPAELQACAGLGPSGAARLSACFELARQLARMPLARRPQITSPADVAEWLGGSLEGAKQEQFRVLLLDSKHRVLKEVLVALGGLNAAVVHPREVLRPAILAAAAALVLVHNHPSGDPEPSDEDLRLTVRFSEACRLMGIDLLDHVVLGGGGFVSLRERGLIP